MSELTANDVNDENGMKVLIEKLDKVLESDKINEAYLVYSRFTNFQKSDEMSMTDYLTEFEHLYHKMTNHEMPLPNTVLTFKLLDGAKLSEDERKLRLILGNNLEFETMTSALKRIFTKSTIANESLHDTNNIKQEEAFYSKNMSKLKQNKTSRSSKSQKVLNSNKHNPFDKNGKVSQCIICDSKMHWADKCPHKSDYQSVNISQEVSSDTENESESEEINIVLMTEEIDTNEISITEASKLAVVDTACIKTG